MKQQDDTCLDVKAGDEHVSLMSKRKILAWLAAGLIALACTAYAAVPTPHRALTPSLFGAAHIGGSLYTDAPDRAEDFHALYKASLSAVEDALGPMKHKPARIVICTTDTCQKRFGFGTIGLALGRHVILLGEGGVGPMILTHELVHIHVKHAYGMRDYVWPRIPAWFDEGLATVISNDPRLTRYAPPEAAWILEAQDFRDWKRMTTAENWQDTYGAAQSLVRDIHDHIGLNGIQSLLQDADTPDAFRAALRHRMGPEWPRSPAGHLDAQPTASQ